LIGFSLPVKIARAQAMGQVKSISRLLKMARDKELRAHFCRFV